MVTYQTTSFHQVLPTAMIVRKADRSADSPQVKSTKKQPTRRRMRDTTTNAIR
jgi:hypothetical protein